MMDERDPSVVFSFIILEHIWYRSQTPGGGSRKLEQSLQRLRLTSLEADFLVYFRLEQWTSLTSALRSTLIMFSTTAVNLLSTSRDPADHHVVLLLVGYRRS